jgi:alcohol dehydrogenase
MIDAVDVVKDCNIDNPVRVMFGVGKVLELGAESQKVGKKAFLVTMPEFSDLGILDGAVESLQQHGVDYRIYDQTKPEPIADDVNAASEVLRDSGCDHVIGLGGGSAIDFAKALSIGATHTGTIWDYVNLSNKPPKEIDSDKVLPIIAIPTSAGTGSEVTSFAVVINTETVQEGTIKEQCVFPKVAIIDPELMVTLPKKWTAITGVDAFAHALESYFNLSNRNQYTDLIAVDAMRYLIKHLPDAYQDGADLIHRSGVAWGAMLAGKAISMAGTTVGHALVHPTDAMVKLPHGVSVSVYLLAVLKHTVPHEPKRFSKLVQYLFPELSAETGEEKLIEAGVDRIEKFIATFEMKNKLSDYEVGEEMIEKVVDETMRYMFRPLNQHPVQFTKEELLAIVTESY